MYTKLYDYCNQKGDLALIVNKSLVDNDGTFAALAMYSETG